MSQELDSIRLETRLRDTFRRYLYTTNLIWDRDPALQDEFWRQLGEERRIMHGPFIQCSPAYKPDLTLRQLIDRKGNFEVSRRMLALPKDVCDPDRPLYSHQVEALRRAANGDSYIVSTGTGSGKSECFILPVINSVLRSPGPGLRAIVVYPMNALANDQLDRLRHLLRATPEITFGRYTGDTPQSEAPESPRDPGAPPNERFFRDEIREAPPHLLLTNFAMLEYLLLRPRDAGVFREHHLQFIILDEAHTYSGAQGIEIGYLMRRLCEHLGLAAHKPQFILTSATLGSGPDARTEIMDFARNLTGGTFPEDALLQGEKIHTFHSDLEDFPSQSQLETSAPDTNAFEQWSGALDQPDQLRSRLDSLGLPITGIRPDAPAREILYALFSRSRVLARAHDLTQEKPRSISELLEALGFPDTENMRRGISWLLAMGANARRDEGCSPLLPVRLHFFCRGLAGGSACLAPDCIAETERSDASWNHFFLDDRQRCDRCSSHVLPMRTCVHCGLPVFSVFLDPQKLQWRYGQSPDVAAPLPVALLTLRDVEPDDSADDEEQEDTQNLFTLCLSPNCRRFDSGAELEQCCTAPQTRTFHRLTGGSAEGHLRRCPNCGGGSGVFPSVLREFRTAEDAPTAVLTEALMRELPEDSTRRDKPACGRNLLVFSDSRQRAAFFAPYLKNTTAESVFLGPVLRAIREAETKLDEPVTVDDAAHRFKKLVQDGQIPTVALRRRDEEGFEYYELAAARLLAGAQLRALESEVRLSLFREVCASPNRADSLSGLGLAAVTFDIAPAALDDARAKLPDVFAPGDAFAKALIGALLLIVARRGAVRFPDDVPTERVADYGEGAPRLFTFHCANRFRDQQREVSRWNPFHAPARTRNQAISRSRILDVLARALKADKSRDEARLCSTLDGLWQWFQDAGLLLQDETRPGEFRLCADRILLTTRAEWHACDNCGRLTPRGALGVCVRHSCSGRLHVVTPAELGRKEQRNHHRFRFLESAFPLEVKEHTAQLTNETGKLYQQRFISGDINVLSSSTTFEMGVDVGGLKAVLLRNMPPRTANYVQRAGRAGRRKDGIAGAVAFARQTPHDQYYYSYPDGMMSGVMAAPVLAMDNAVLGQRHVNSLLLGTFLRHMAEKLPPENLDRLTLSRFFLIPLADQSQPLALAFADWTRTPDWRGDLEAAIKAILPSDSPLQPGDALVEAAESLVGMRDTSVLNRHVADPRQRFEEQLQELKDALIAAAGAGENTRGLSSSLDSLKKLAAQFDSQQLLDFLSSSSWLPGYAFPQDVVKLLVRNAEYSDKMRLERDRETGLSEYAPGAEIVADGKLFASRAIWFQSREPDIRWYVRCPSCRKIETFLESETPPNSCSRCGTGLTGNQRHRCLKPGAFSTHVEDPVREPGTHRQKPPRTSEVFLLEGADESGFQDHTTVPGLRFGWKRDGRLFRVNTGYNGKGFRICRRCGLSFDGTAGGQQHVSPWGTRCGGLRTSIHLTHEITTDILQLRFAKAPPINDRSFWLSLQTAVTRAASESIDIDPADIDATHGGWSQQSRSGELVIYDRVPGGAGHIPRMIEHLDTILRAARDRMQDCRGCSDLDSSCYACLRSYGNQFWWEQLQRRPVLVWLDRLLAGA